MTHQKMVHRSTEYVVMRYVENLNWYLVIHGENSSIRGKDVLPIVVGGVLVMLFSLTCQLASEFI